MYAYRLGAPPSLRPPLSPRPSKAAAPKGPAFCFLNCQHLPPRACWLQELRLPRLVAPSTVRPLTRGPWVLIGWPLPLGFGLNGCLLLARRGRVCV